MNLTLSLLVSDMCLSGCSFFNLWNATGVLAFLNLPGLLLLITTFLYGVAVTGGVRTEVQLCGPQIQFAMS